jgi:hypothetical protein
MLTRAQYSTPKNPNLPLLIFREGAPTNKLINVTNKEKEQFLSVMKYGHKSKNATEKPYLSAKKNIDEETQCNNNGPILIPGVKLVNQPALHPVLIGRRISSYTYSRYSESDDSDNDDDEGNKRLLQQVVVADCTGCGKTHSFRPKKYFQHTIHGIYCGQYKDNVRTVKNKEVVSKTISNTSSSSKQSNGNSRRHHRHHTKRITALKERTPPPGLIDLKIVEVEEEEKEEVEEEVEEASLLLPTDLSTSFSPPPPPPPSLHPAAVHDPPPPRTLLRPALGVNSS